MKSVVPGGWHYPAISILPTPGYSRMPYQCGWCGDTFTRWKNFRWHEIKCFNEAGGKHPEEVR